MRGWRGEWLLAVCLVLLQLLVPIDCKGRLVDTRALSPPTRPLTSQVDDELVEHLWLSCGLDMRILEDVKNHFHYTLLFDIVRSSYGPAIKNASPPEIRIEEDTSGTLSPEVTHAFLNCLSKQNIPFGDTGRDDARSFLAQYVKSLFASRRRDLAQESSATAPSPTPAPSLPLTPSPGTATQSAHLVPKSPSLSKPAKEPTESVLSPPPAEINHLKKAKHTPKSVAKKKNSNNMSTNTVIGLCVSGVALLALVCLCCCACCTNRSAAYDSKDDKPLLSLSLSDFSGSSRNSYSHGTPIDINKLGALSLKSEAGHDSMKLSSHGNLLNAEGHPVVYNTSAEPPDASISSVPGAKPPPPPVTPPPAHPKAPPPQAPKVAPGAPSGPQPQPAAKAGPPPPPPKSAGPPRPPPPTMPSSSKARPPPRFKKEGDVAAIDADSDAAKTKLKPFFWDKVAANPDQSMVWNHIKAGSFQFDEEMIENLFGYNTTDKKNSDSKKDISSKDAPQFVRILEPKKAQNLAISLKALSVSAEAVCSAVMEGTELPSELIQTLLRWTPTNDEELRLRLYTGEHSQLGPVEQYLRAIINVPYIFQRLEALLFMASLPEEAAHVKQSFATLEVACEELRNSRLFLKLLEAVLKTGNRMNVGTFRGGAHAFKLDTLLKLSDVKGTDGKTTLLHFVVQEIIRSEGVRAVRVAKEHSSSLSSVNSDGLTDDVVHETEDDYKQLGLKVVSSLGDELQNVRKAAGLDADALTISVASLGHKLVKTNEFLNTSMKSMDEESGFHHKLKHFIEQSQADVTFLLEEEKRIRSLVRSTIDYFHGTTGKDEGLRLFVVVRDFLGMLDKVCKEVKEASKAAAKKPRTRQPSQSSPSFLDPRRNLFPAIQDRRADNSSSDEEH